MPSPRTRSVARAGWCCTPPRRAAARTSTWSASTRTSTCARPQAGGSRAGGSYGSKRADVAVKQLAGAASGEAAASIERCAAVLTDVASYPSWYPAVVQEAEVLEDGPEGRPSRVRTVLAIAIGPFRKELAFTLGVDVTWPREVTLTRLPF